MSGRWGSVLNSEEMRYSSPKEPQALEVRRSDWMVDIGRCCMIDRRSSVGSSSILVNAVRC